MLFFRFLGAVMVDEQESEVPPRAPPIEDLRDD